MKRFLVKRISKDKEDERMSVLSETTEELYQMNDNPVTLLDKVYPIHSVILTRRTVTEYEDFYQTTLEFTMSESKE